MYLYQKIRQNVEVYWKTGSTLQIIMVPFHKILTKISILETNHAFLKSICDTDPRHSKTQL